MMNRRQALALATGLLATPSVLRAGTAPIKIRDLYTKDRTMSDLALSLVDTRTTFEGFMAPPLKADSRFFVMTKMPMSVCPFCETSAEWPDTILAVYTKRVVDVVPFNVGIETRGVLEIGEYRDPDTGFVSMVRLADATYGR